MHFTFNATSFPGFYDASNDKTNAYNIPEILKDIRKKTMWNSYGRLFKKVGSELAMDPYALAAYCIFESYNSDTHNFNPKKTDPPLKDYTSGSLAAGIGATQANEKAGTTVPGLDVTLPGNKNTKEGIIKAAEALRNNPEYSLRYLAQEFKESYSSTHDLAKSFPKVAYPDWPHPNQPKGNYGTQAQYVSRAFVFYKAFRSADSQ